MQPSDTPAASAQASTPTVNASPAGSLPTLALVTPSLPPAVAQPPYSTVHIVVPGPGSRLTSPVAVEANAIPGADGAVTIQIVGEDGRVMATNIQYFATPKGQRVGFVTSLGFQLAGVAEAARLQVSVRDARGRLQALSSADLLLLASGEDVISPEPDPHEHFILVSPAPNGVGKKGELRLAGYISPFNGKPVLFELLGNQGEALASASFPPQNESAAYQPFTGILRYSIPGPTWALLVVRQPDARIPGDAALTSQLVYLNP